MTDLYLTNENSDTDIMRILRFNFFNNTCILTSNKNLNYRAMFEKKSLNPSLRLLLRLRFRDKRLADLADDGARPVAPSLRAGFLEADVGG